MSDIHTTLIEPAPQSAEYNMLRAMRPVRPSDDNYDLWMEENQPPLPLFPPIGDERAGIDARTAYAKHLLRRRFAEFMSRVAGWLGL